MGGESLGNLLRIIKMTPKNDMSPLTSMREHIAAIITDEKFDKRHVKIMFNMLYSNGFTLERIYNKINQDKPENVMIPLFLSVSLVDDDSDNVFYKAETVLRQYVKRNIDINQTIEGETLLEIALDSGNYRIVEMILSKKIPLKLSRNFTFLNDIVQPIHLIFIKNFYPELITTLVNRIDISNDLDRNERDKWMTLINSTLRHKIIPNLKNKNEITDKKAQDFIDKYSKTINRVKGRRVRNRLMNSRNL